MVSDQGDRVLRKSKLYDKMDYQNCLRNGIQAGNLDYLYFKGTENKGQIIENFKTPGLNIKNYLYSTEMYWHNIFKCLQFRKTFLTVKRKTGIEELWLKQSSQKAIEKIKIYI